MAAGDIIAIMPGMFWANARTARTAAAPVSPAIARSRTSGSGDLHSRSSMYGGTMHCVDRRPIAIPPLSRFKTRNMGKKTRPSPARLGGLVTP